MSHDLTKAIQDAAKKDKDLIKVVTDVPSTVTGIIPRVFLFKPDSSFDVAEETSEWIYKNIKKFRIESGLSIIEVADILDMSYDYIRRIESNNDKVKTCSLKLLIKFSILYNKNLGDFLVE